MAKKPSEQSVDERGQEAVTYCFDLDDIQSINIMAVAMAVVVPKPPPRFAVKIVVVPKPPPA
ncbi:hypothetical protein ACVWWQ_001870 [Rhodanobacter sp. TND4EL1]